MYFVCDPAIAAYRTRFTIKYYIILKGDKLGIWIIKFRYVGQLLICQLTVENVWYWLPNCITLSYIGIRVHTTHKTLATTFYISNYQGRKLQENDSHNVPKM